MAALSAPTIAFMDTASSTVGDSPDQVQERYAKIFEGGLPDLIFTHLRYAFGRGWAAVIWTASSLGAGGDGVTVLEIRDGRIARETLYYTSTKHAVLGLDRRGGWEPSGFEGRGALGRERS